MARKLEPIKDEIREIPGNADGWICRILEVCQFPPVTLCWLSAIWSQKKAIQDLVFQLFPLKTVLLLLFWRMEFFAFFIPQCGRVLCFISGVLVRDGESLRGKFSTKVSDNESIEKEPTMRLCTHGSQEPPLVSSWWRNLGQCHLKSNYFLS